MIVLLVTVLVLFIVGIPISISLAVASLATMIYMDVNPIVMSQKFITGMDSLPLLAIPGYLLAGEIMCRGGLAARLLSTADAFIGHLRNGLSCVTITAGMFFSAMNGTASATTAAIGEIMIPEMKKRGYPSRYTAGLAAVVGPLGPIIPPSVIMIVYAVGANIAVGDLFLSGVIPGILLGCALIAMSFFLTRKMDLQVERKRSFKERVIAVKDGFWSLLTPLIVLGGIYGGFCTPTEAAVIAVFYSLVVAAFIHKEMTIPGLMVCLRNTVHMSAMIMLIVGAATGFGWMIAVTDINTAAANFILSISTNPTVVILLISLALVVIGCFLDTVAAIVIFQTVFIPIAAAIGMDMLHFAALFIVIIAIGNATPPFGYAIFVAAKVSHEPLEEVSKVVLPLVCAMLVIVVFLIFFPSLSTFLPYSLK